jgi:hypothetical protein
MWALAALVGRSNGVLVPPPPVPDPSLPFTQLTFASNDCRHLSFKLPNVGGLDALGIEAENIKWVEYYLWLTEWTLVARANEPDDGWEARLLCPSHACGWDGRIVVHVALIHLTTAGETRVRASSQHVARRAHTPPLTTPRTAFARASCRRTTSPRAQ